MLKLCEILKINVNDLLCGETVSMENYNRELENNLLEMVKQKEECDKRLLRMEILTGILCVLPLILSTVLVSFVNLEEWVETLIVGASVLPLFLAAPFMIRVEQIAGYYECQKCRHRYVPEYKRVFFSMHLDRTRYMKCPKCRKRSWQKKVLSKEDLKNGSDN
jgi:hypothetical protein